MPSRPIYLEKGIRQVVVHGTVHAWFVCETVASLTILTLYHAWHLALGGELLGGEWVGWIAIFGYIAEFPFRYCIAVKKKTRTCTDSGSIAILQVPPEWVICASFSRCGHCRLRIGTAREKHAIWMFNVPRSRSPPLCLSFATRSTPESANLSISKGWASLRGRWPLSVFSSFSALHRWEKYLNVL